MNPEIYIEALNRGEVVAFPTETVYGLGARYDDQDAIQRIFQLKGRPSDNPLIVHISDAKDLHLLASDVPETALKLADHFWPGPLTFILRKKDQVSDLLTGGLDTVAVRMPDNKLALSLIKGAGPLVAPSANISGKPSPTSYEHVREDFGDQIMIADGGSTSIGLESTVLDLSGAKPVILRPGAIGPDEIFALTGLNVEYQVSGEHKVTRSPGQKYAHYQPKAEVIYGPVNEFRSDTLYLLQSVSPTGSNIINYNGDLKSLSRDLYMCFRKADQMQFNNVHIASIEDQKEKYPTLHQALLNRIQKAIG